MSRPGSGACFLEFFCTEPHADDAMEEEKMELMHRRCCGLDVHKETVVACLRLVFDGQVTTEVRTFRTTTCLRWPGHNRSADLPDDHGGPSTLVEVAGGKRVHACGDGSNRRLLEAGVAYLGCWRVCVAAGKRRACEERDRAARPTSTTRRGWLNCWRM